jgi:plastocyanin
MILPYLKSIRNGALAVVLALSALSGASTASAEDTARVLVENFMFTPNSLTVTAGTTVTWTNLDAEPHTVSSDTGLFRSGALDTNDSFEFKFDEPGTYHFICSIHPQMVGTIVVE